jgi:nitroreductase
LDACEAIQKRKSIRDYETNTVPREMLQKLLEAARLSPSANNVQPWHFVVVTDVEKRKILSKGLFAKFLKDSPAVIVLCGDERASPEWYIVDVALAGENMVIAATNEGLGTCWVGSFDEKEVKSLLSIPENLRVVALLSIGYPKEKVGVTTRILRLVRRRKALNEISSWETYGNTLLEDNKGDSNEATTG